MSTIASLSVKIDANTSGLDSALSIATSKIKKLTDGFVNAGEIGVKSLIENKKAAEKLDEALNGTIDGIITLANAESVCATGQEKLSKTIQEVSDMAIAQQSILDDLNELYMLSAESAGTTFSGQLDVLYDAFDTIVQEISSAVIPILDLFYSWISDSMPGIQNVIETVFGKMGEVLNNFSSVFSQKIMSSFEGFLNWTTQNSPVILKSYKDLYGGIGIEIEKTTNKNKEFIDTVGKVPDIFKNLNTPYTPNMGDIASALSIIDSTMSIVKAVGLASIAPNLITNMTLALTVLAALAFVAVAIYAMTQKLPSLEEAYKNRQMSMAVLENEGLTISKNYAQGMYSKKSYAVGSRYIPFDMIAQVHQGEMIIPKSENPYANSNGPILPQVSIRSQGSASGRTDALLEEMIGILQQFFPQFSNRQVVLDSGAVVGALTPAIDNSLATMRKRKERGN